MEREILATWAVDEFVTEVMAEGFGDFQVKSEMCEHPEYETHFFYRSDDVIYYARSPEPHPDEDDRIAPWRKRKF